MARDNSPAERQKKQLERKLGQRASYDRILIVSEGSKTEPNYFKDIRAAYRLQTANIEVQPSGFGTGPIQVVQYARSLFDSGDRHKQIQPRAFEQIYAVFDRDDHQKYFEALKLAEELDGKLRNDNRQTVAFTKSRRISFAVSGSPLIKSVIASSSNACENAGSLCTRDATVSLKSRVNAMITILFSRQPAASDCESPSHHSSSTQPVTAASIGYGSKPMKQQSCYSKHRANTVN